jgi:hypothetical protein
MGIEDDPLKLPKQEDVSMIPVEDSHIGVVRITDDNKEYLANFALRMYLGEKCKFCLREFITLEDLKDAVYAGYHEYGRIACKSCWESNDLP